MWFRCNNGVKKIKAIVISGKGNKKLNFADKDKLVDLEKMLQARIRNTDYAKVTREHGRALAIIPYETKGNLPIRYWTGDTWEEGAYKIGAPAFTNELNARGLSCIYCPIACHRKVEIHFKGTLLKVSGPEYETLGMLGSCLDIDNVKDIAYANHLCNSFGIDRISLGAYVGFIIRCFQEGLLNQKAYPNLKFERGSKDLLFNMIRLISESKSIGAIFKEGIAHASQEIGGEAKKIAAHVKGLDIPAYDPEHFIVWQ